MFNYKRKNYFIIYCLILISILLFLLIKTPGLKGGIDQELRIITKNPIIIDTRNPLNESLPNVFIAIKDLFSFDKNKFETLKIDIDFQNLDILKKDRSNALKNGMLINPNKVNAKINLNGKKIDASVRLKGDFNDHRNYNKQWSLKFNLRNSENIFEMTEFSLTNHRSRNYPYNFIISKNLERMKLHVPKFKTVKVIFNGYDWGLMLIEEHFTKEFLENRKLKNGLIFKISNEEKMIFEHLHFYQNQKIAKGDYRALTRWQDILNINYHNKKNFSKKKLNAERKDFLSKLSLIKTINTEINFNKNNSKDKIIEKYFDLESFAIMFVSSLAWGESNFHSMEFNNSRFYVNPYNLKIIPIPADYEFIFKMYSHEDSNENLENYKNAITNNMFYLPMFYQSIFLNDKFEIYYEKALKDFEKNISFIEDDINKLCFDYSKICNNLIKIEKLKTNVINLKKINTDIFDLFRKKYPIHHKSTNEVYEKHLNQKNFNSLKYFNLYENHLNIRAFNNGNIEIKNLTNTKIKIKSIIIDDLNYLKKTNFSIEPSKYTLISEKNFNLGVSPNLNSKIKIKYSFDNEIDNKIYETFIEEKILLIDDNTKFFNFKKNGVLINEKNIIFDSKEYLISNPIHIPDSYNLVIKAGANLKFSKDSYIFGNNVSLSFLGEKNKNIYLTSLEESWKGIHIIGNKKKSKINFTKFSNLNYFNNSKFNLTGGINFYDSFVDIKNSDFSKSYSEDMLNLIHSKFNISNCNFSNNSSDAIDSDYSEGLISGSTFQNVKGDAIDTSGSSVIISDVSINNVVDKGISVGEKSNVKVINTSIFNTSIGIASKDSSIVTGNNLTIKKSKKYDLASYNKKKIFNGGNIDISNVKSDKKFLSQNKSKIIINNKKIAEKKFNSKDLY